MTMEEVFKGTKGFKQVFKKVQHKLNQLGLLIYNVNVKQLVERMNAFSNIPKDEFQTTDVDIKKEAQKKMTSSTDHQKEGVNEVAKNVGGRTSDSSTSIGFFYQHKTKEEKWKPTRKAAYHLDKRYPGIGHIALHKSRNGLRCALHGSRLWNLLEATKSLDVYLGPSNLMPKLVEKRAQLQP